MSRYLSITGTVNNENSNNTVVSDLGNNSTIIDNNSSENTSDNTKDNTTRPLRKTESDFK